MDFDIWFAWMVFGSGLVLVLPQQFPRLRERCASIHPFGRSAADLERTGWVFVIVGGLWSVQNLWIA